MHWFGRLQAGYFYFKDGQWWIGCLPLKILDYLLNWTGMLLSPPVSSLAVLLPPDSPRSVWQYQFPFQSYLFLLQFCFCSSPVCFCFTDISFYSVSISVLTNFVSALSHQSHPVCFSLSSRTSLFYSPSARFLLPLLYPCTLFILVMVLPLCNPFYWSLLKDIHLLELYFIRVVFRYVVTMTWTRPSSDEWSL